MFAHEAGQQSARPAARIEVDQTRHVVARVAYRGAVDLRLNIRALEHDLAAFEEIKNLKLWPKTIKLAPPKPIFDAMPF
ncbi:hypothetical protein P3W85_33625 [Cupriavidus basilensis]|uniref:Uncharacterized protein n=1 Tax=Cupriavidus basilensis TaxID=68895 RepID=A0ABT6AYZ5_9BURK|nr:hypothetical protein [Cupriavidus basilensis]MDF3837840.1 hypothetical protein [Cupriavidus basilensis]